MKQVNASKVQDGTLVKRTLKSRTWFKVITKGDFGVVITSQSSEFSALLKKSAKVFIKQN